MYYTIGSWLVHKYQRIASERGVFHAAKLMRKQGVPFSLAIATLTGKGLGS